MLAPLAMQSISKAEIKDLLSHALKHQYRVQDRDKKSESVMDKTLDLFRLDYHTQILANAGGELGTNYPSRIALLSPVRGGGGSGSGGGPTLDAARLHRLAQVARMGRCRGRFPVPVILYRGQHICRSSTLSVGAEMYPRHYFYSIFGGAPAGGEASGGAPSAADAPSDPPSPPSPPDETPHQLFDRIRSMDMKLLRLFSVRTIADLMVENKKVKFGVCVSSSEKVDKQERYADFDLLSLPYPGCEFFQQYCQGGYQGAGLLFDWNQSYIDAEVVLPLPLQRQLAIQWPLYRTWDIVQLTQNYMRLLLHCLHAGPDGLLIHCISGWDRTPLFISLLRLTLWADGLIHTALDASQVLYLTLAYDWFLFGHSLPDRVAKDEEIMHFAFNFLLHIDTDEFSASNYGGAKQDELQRTESDVHLVGGVLLEGLETDASSIHSSCSSAASDAGGCGGATLAAGGGSESWPFVEAHAPADSHATSLASLEASLSEVELSSSSSCSSGRRPVRRRRRRGVAAPAPAPAPADPAAAGRTDAPRPYIGSRSDSCCQPAELRPPDASPALGRRAERKARLLERQGSGSLESLPEQKFWPARPVPPAATGPPELRPCRSEAGSFSGGTYHETYPGTSPVTVPGGNRARHESTDSVGRWVGGHRSELFTRLTGDNGAVSPLSDSWQIINGSEGVNGSGSNGSIRSGSSHSRSSYQSMGPEFTESTTTLIDESGEQTCKAPETRRSARLRAVRTLFLQSYSASVGLKTGPLSQRTPSAAGFSLVPAIVSNIAGRVGILMT